jgi:proton-translocating NADH-quinone oxidoreductase chain N
MCSMFIMVPLFVLMFINLPLRPVKKYAALPLILILTALVVGAMLFTGFDFRVRLCGIFEFGLFVDGLSRMMLLTISVITFMGAIVASHFERDEDRRSNFLSLILVAFIGMNGIVLVKDIFSLYVFLEITAVASFIMIAFGRGMDSLEGAYKYFVFSALASVLMLSSIAFLFIYTGDTSYINIAGAVKGGSSGLIIAAIGLFSCAFFMKAGLMPFHWWLPDAYSSAPHPASLMLAGIVTKVVGVYPFIRLLPLAFTYNNNICSVIMFFGAVSMVLAAFAAFTQTDMKRMLAYSSISQVGYMILSIGTGTPLGFAGAVFHFFNHAIFKSTLFINAAAVESGTSTRDMDKMGGLAQKMPATGLTSALACLSTAGMPPLSGFWSKLIIIIALWTSGNRAYAVIAILTSLVTLSYMLVLQRKVFFGKPSAATENVKEAEIGLVFPAVALTVIMLAVSALFPLLINTFFVPIGGL